MSTEIRKPAVLQSRFTSIGWTNCLHRLRARRTTAHKRRELQTD
jgi:hypothetical protein